MLTLPPFVVVGGVMALEVTLNSEVDAVTEEFTVVEDPEGGTVLEELVVEVELELVVELVVEVELELELVVEVEREVIGVVEVVKVVF